MAFPCPYTLVGLADIYKVLKRLAGDMYRTSVQTVFMVLIQMNCIF